ncbi:MAG TPA: hypothetical protein VN370_15025 [Desulfitobacteriaceae bacterium]|nr:hypothetical protein [Desulfitobacteriaceae bacterium]
MKDSVGHGEKRSRREELALAALIAEPTLAKAAQAAGIGEVTLWRWLQDEDFQNKYRTIRRQAVTQAVAQLQKASSEAVQTLQGIMNDAETPAASRVTAARTILDMSLKAIEIEDLAGRVEALEKALKASEKKRCSA